MWQTPSELPMKSPFPGMDPWLEEHWLDVHSRLVLYAADQLQPQLGGQLRARVEERLVIEGESGEPAEFYADVRIVERSTPGAPVKPAGAMVAEPIVLRATREQRTETSIRIMDVGRGNVLVTVIEFLSPANKAGGDATRQYQRKQVQVLEAGANLVEIDLLRAGRRVFYPPVRKLPAQLQCEYQACVRRAASPDEHELYPMPLRQKLPTIRVPLREGDPDVALDIQALVAQAYERGAYDDIDYSRPPTPPLDEEQQAWAGEVVKGRG